MQKLLITFATVAFAILSFAQDPARAEKVEVVASLREYHLVGAVLDGIDGTSEHFDVLTMVVEQPEDLKKEQFAVWIRIPTVFVEDTTAGERAAYWRDKIQCRARLTIDQRVFSEPQSFPCALACDRDSLKWEKKTAEPGATDNPDDAQRLREDH